ncbi:MAG: hypothetical protein P8K68_00960 [Algibacter sp.]|uniref:hypothetical protein n=1 Tax=Algibacter sp. TaxID=1872428 RepID=UPI00261F9424|nr:hypothetical protein [Algibacter sp.]MDG1729340.1 hypothetical protein [Algibacter sp.]MDG2177342.1 hypothetical protein [Algibacter sp.]
MKLQNLKHYVLSALLSILFVSCSSDSGETNKETNSSFLDPDEVSENVIIAGSNYINGKLPNPNEKISFELLEKDQFAIPLEGFDIPLETEEPIVGAYIQFEHNDGTPASGYFDINIKANLLGKPSNIKNNINFNQQSSIDVDFNKNIPPAKFCYTICVYDEAQNISAPQRICIEVSPLGKNSVLANEWNFLKRETFAISDGITEPFTYEVGDVVINIGGSADCAEAGLRYEYSGEIVQGSGKLVLNSDGTYLYEDNSTTDVLDYIATKQQCNPVWLEKINRKFQNSGVWSYIEEDNRLILISYRRFRIDGDEIAFDQITEPGDGYLFWDATIVLNDNTILIKNGDGVTEDSAWYTYIK